jgi:Ca2+-binding EF-hand superfamily protein
LKAAFESADADKSGSINAEELFNMMKGLGFE